MSYTKKQYDTKVTIDFNTLNTEQALFLATFLKGESRTALHMFFYNTLNYINRETNKELKNKLIEAHPYILKLKKLADKFNQRDAGCPEDQCVLTHDKRPYNNLKNSITVNNGKIEIKDRESYGLYVLEIMCGGKYEGNLEYFVETYEEDILKAAPFLVP